jgi:Rrf2 family transcriptional regulator, iron-sulfur cluster assembly transcription factor
MLTKSSQYAIKALLYLSLYGNANNRINSKKISTELNIPQHYLGKILQRLANENYLVSFKGPNGGFYINKNKEKVNLLEIIKIIDGKEYLSTCALGFESCSDENPCPVHFFVKEYKNNLINKLHSVKIKDLKNDIQQKNSFLKSVL